MEVRNSSFAAYIDVFTSNTYAMVVMSDVGICKYCYCLLLSMTDRSRSLLLPMCLSYSLKA